MTHAPLPPPGVGSPFLTIDDALILRRGVRGVVAVDVRLIGAHPTAGAEVVAFLEAEGLETSMQRIEHMQPPPLRRLVFRYAGNRAELTVAPNAAD
ncbi:hypothetical protein SAMN05421774_101225 [Gemmobacter megaterium]|uniref:Uncharacterized protein n=1 Tax=Gemmobacter megaterium TaxID=1086013 RepID=A0A1N7K573_9RHOB|nr:hypothetical protein [Gemmobacter megaterium]GGE00455.1 hypothetical protein GCM10011345_02200 [Gemmobacter megaterium]SIS56729.1 hypothetical protein SAMN05421774_101225 [Gemmobacter megaterium]